MEEDHQDEQSVSFCCCTLNAKIGQLRSAYSLFTVQDLTDNPDSVKNLKLDIPRRESRVNHIVATGRFTLHAPAQLAAGVRTERNIRSRARLTTTNCPVQPDPTHTSGSNKERCCGVSSAPQPFLPRAPLEGYLPCPEEDAEQMFPLPDKHYGDREDSRRMKAEDVGREYRAGIGMEINAIHFEKSANAQISPSNAWNFCCCLQLRPLTSFSLPRFS
ncbi:hypothetical protein EXN66_Car018177 [Channa argus]|uniref:Uncharacterized protein n=1 Tax=Channa argus TaxID=215402 RepID=A0A6G1QJC1_CHAAH|nr:hypothetical protein EXN66_Car018177 [Channa argus]